MKRGQKGLSFFTGWGHHDSNQFHAFDIRISQKRANSLFICRNDYWIEDRLQCRNTTIPLEHDVEVPFQRDNRQIVVEVISCCDALYYVECSLILE